ncbi:Nucleoporin SEH1 [Chionoecetes opilio]|uniref:Nucleoporin SEH1 n=1 Tax=Chionoecetes opilio TaxID=41210 RepID=A0A8J4YX84_CHIOP|nr:Nucleoporin SEH1 [Chionoecetes opilio]
MALEIWDLNEDKEWVCTASWKTHCGSVWKVTWAHPEFGQIIATCSFDRTAAIWEESVSDSGHGIHSTWIKRAGLVDSRTSVTDIKFAPKLQGLQLATCSAGGVACPAGASPGKEEGHGGDVSPRRWGTALASTDAAPASAPQPASADEQQPGPSHKPQPGPSNEPLPSLSEFEGFMMDVAEMQGQRSLANELELTPSSGSHCVVIQ